MTQTADQGSIGASQQGPNDSSSEYSKVAFLVRQIQAQLEIMMPVEVVTFHAGSGSPPGPGTVDVQLLVSQLDGNGNAVPHGIVYGLPYWRLQGGPWAVILDPAANDFGFIIAASRDITSVQANPGIQNPGSLRKYSYSDGIYLGGIFNAVPAAILWLKSDGTLQVTDAPGNVISTSAAGITATPVSGGAFIVNGPINATGKITAPDFSDGTVISILTHTHGGVQTGSGTTGPPTPGS
jgi:hypothetical protein